ncbi:UNVERIFIED_CONTAM: hypothetical protein FKN15_062944 [Acipenser sinensis]
MRAGPGSVSGPIQIYGSPVHLKEVQYREWTASVQANPILSLHNSIFNDMKALIQPIADSIETIDNRLDVIENRNSARSPATIMAPISGPASASVSASAPPTSVPAVIIPEYNLASAVDSGSPAVSSIQHHSLSPHIRRQIIDGCSPQLKTVLGTIGTHVITSVNMIE